MSLSHFFFVRSVRFWAKLSIISIKYLDIVYGVYMFSVFVLQIYSLKLAANSQRLLGIQYTRSFIHVYMPALRCCLPPSVFIFVFRCTYFVWYLRFNTRVFAKDESIVERESSGEYICAVGPCWSNYVQLWAIRCVQIILEQIQAITCLAFNWILYVCVCCVHGRFYQQAKIVHLNFGFVLFLCLPFKPVQSVLRCEWVSKVRNTRTSA